MTVKRSDDMLHSVPVLLSKRADDAGKLTGYAAIFDVLDLNGDSIVVGAFKSSIAARPTVPFLWSHNPERVIGQVTRQVEDHHGLKIEAAMNLDTIEGREAHASLKAGDVKGLSIGFRTRDRDGVMLKAIDVFEISAVAIPANPAARVIEVKGEVHKITSPVAMKKHLRMAGVSRALAEKIVDQHWAEIGDDDEKRRCTFCAKAHDEVKKMLAWGPDCACGDCVTVLAKELERHSLPLNPLKAALVASTQRWSKS